MSNERRVLLLPHPGKERLPDEGRLTGDFFLCNWPKGSRHKKKHRRKFMQIKGQWHDLHGHEGEELLEMWTEYEAPTTAEALIGKKPGEARYVHKIIQEVGKPTLNTDPWMFYPGFVWTTCRHEKANGATEVPSEGDIVLFGSSVGGAWVLDTVLVIDDRQNGIPKGKFGAEYDALVGSNVKLTERPFIGKRFQDIRTPFSFVPCKHAGNGHAPFARPRMNHLFEKLRRKGKDTPIPSVGNSQALTFTYPAKGIATFWSELLRLIDKQGLVMGTLFKHPGIITIGAGSWRKKPDCSPSRSKEC